MKTKTEIGFLSLLTQIEEKRKSTRKREDSRPKRRLWNEKSHF
jgi:hypothetical protein